MAAIAAVLVAATLGSIVGSGFAPLCAAMLLPLMRDPVQVVTILILSSIAFQFLSGWALRHSIDRRALLPFRGGAVAGLSIGVKLLLHMDAGNYMRAIGGTLILNGATCCSADHGLVAWSCCRCGRPACSADASDRASGS